VRHALSWKQKLRCYRKLVYGAGSWECERRLVARLEVSPTGLDVRYIVTSLKGGAKHLYETICCARGERRAPWLQLQHIFALGTIGGQTTSPTAHVSRVKS
jgi:hypothetical protein